MKTFGLSNNFASYDKKDIVNELLNLGFKIGRDYIWGYNSGDYTKPVQIYIINPQMLVDASTIINAITY